jgi:hypothetical protein
MRDVDSANARAVRKTLEDVMEHGATTGMKLADKIAIAQVYATLALAWEVECLAQEVRR